MFRITRISQNGEHRPQFSSHLEEQNVYLVCSEHLVLVRIGGFCLKWWNVATKIHGNIKRAQLELKKKKKWDLFLSFHVSVLSYGSQIVKNKALFCNFALVSERKVGMLKQFINIQASGSFQDTISENGMVYSILSYSSPKCIIFANLRTITQYRNMET